MPVLESKGPDKAAPLAEIRLQVPMDLYGAFQRCLWIRINETGRTQLELMEEVIRDFLAKHGC